MAEPVGAGDEAALERTAIEFTAVTLRRRLARADLERLDRIFGDRSRIDVVFSGRLGKARFIGNSITKAAEMMDGGRRTKGFRVVKLSVEGNACNLQWRWWSRQLKLQGPASSVRRFRNPELYVRSYFVELLLGLIGFMVGSFAGTLILLPDRASIGDETALSGMQQLATFGSAVAFATLAPQLTRLRQLRVTALTPEELEATSQSILDRLETKHWGLIGLLGLVVGIVGVVITLLK